MKYFQYVLVTDDRQTDVYVSVDLYANEADCEAAAVAMLETDSFPTYVTGFRVRKVRVVQ